MQSVRLFCATLDLYAVKCVAFPLAGEGVGYKRNQTPFYAPCA